MKLYRFKIVLLHGIAFLAGYTSIFSCYPFSVAFFAAACASDRFRYTIFPVIVLGMTLTAEVGQLLLYAPAMLLVLLLSWILEGKKRAPNLWVQGILAAASLLAMSWALGEDLYAAAGEAVLVLSLTVMFALLLDSFLITNTRSQKEEIIHGPGKMKLEESAEVFRRLAGCFGELPHKQTGFNNEDRDRMSLQMSEQFCSSCSKCLECWEKNYYDTMTTTSDLFEQLEQQGKVAPEKVRGRMATQCIRLRAYISEMGKVFERARVNLFWYNRLIENREAVAGQLTEMANMMTAVAEDIYDTGGPEDLSLKDRIDRALKREQIVVKKTSLSQKKNGRREVYITMRTKGNCISTREIAGYITGVTEVPMVPRKDSRRVLNKELATVAFVEDTAYRVLHGVAKAVKPGQQVSGDNFSFVRTDEGQAVACLSDGMGYGVRACRESQTVVELLERFLEAGFPKETALKMINSTMVLADGEPNCSTIDVCAVDLYDGVCEFLKLGAAASYIRRDHWVELIQSTSLPAGVFHQAEYDRSSKKLFDGDFVILVSDGLIDALSDGGEDDRMESVILDQKSANPKEIANGILGEALEKCNYDPADDMTVLVLGIWKK